LDDKVDVYAFGNMLYSIVTGKWPSHDIEMDMRQFQARNYYIETRLGALIKRLWDEQPNNRPDIFEVLKYLRETKKNYAARGK